MLIDCHAHHITKGMLNRDDHWGPFITNNGLKVGHWLLGTKTLKEASSDEKAAEIAWLERMTPEARLSGMDELGVDQLVLSVPSHLYMYWAGGFGTEYAHIVNDELAAYCDAAPDRLTYWGHANLADPGSAVKEIDRAVTQLGAKGLSAGGANFGGLQSDSPELFGVWEKVCELGVPVYVHGYNQSVTWGEHANDDRYDSTSIVGMCSDEALFFWNMVCGGVLDEFPDLTVYITHGGGFVPYQVNRFAETNLTMAPDSKNRRDVREYLPNFYFDLDIHSRAMRQAVVEDIGADRLLYGTNFGGADSHRSDLTEGLGMSDADRAKIRSENAISLLKLKV